MIIRPYGIVISGRLELGLELEIKNSRITEIRPHTGIPDPFIVSPAFVNAHSHLEYRGMLGKLKSEEYFDWIQEITGLKRTQSDKEVEEDCLLAASENQATGVARIGEHSDRPFAGYAFAMHDLDGIIFQELITIFEADNAAEKAYKVHGLRLRQRTEGSVMCLIAPHTPYTVDRETLRRFGHREDRYSMHVAESTGENELFKYGEGPIADFYKKFRIAFEPTGKSVVATLADWGLTRPTAQFVHCCDLHSEDIGILARDGVKVAHCPRSNVRLQCPPAPVREMLDAGIKVGLGLDSAASSGPIDMFAEMRAALSVSLDRGKPLTGEEVWSMATGMGNESLPWGDHPAQGIYPRLLMDVKAPWDIFSGSRVPLIKINLEGVLTTDEMIERGSPSTVEWVSKGLVKERKENDKFNLSSRHKFLHG